ncbi:MAG: T9SS type A sorting domain-containing protein [Ignavibacteriaceae bacterium]|nr:T9SS type A sorting domain-containing protein [Ignavibacteriaceae bacterium]
MVDGDEIWFRWQDNDDAGTTDKILAVDDFSFNQNGDPLPVELTSFSALLINKEVKLNWQTATEINNYGFEIERSENRSQKSEGNNTEQVWETIGFVEGNGNSNSPKEYSFTDASAMLSTSSSSSFGASKLIYRLKQIDTDGKYEYSNEIEVDFDGLPSQFSLEQNYPNPFNPSTKIKYVIPVVETGHAPSLRVALKIFDALGNEVATLVNEVKEPGFYEIDWNANGLSSGVYYYRLTASGGAGSFTQSKKLMLIK